MTFVNQTDNLFNINTFYRYVIIQKLDKGPLILCEVAVQVGKLI